MIQEYNYSAINKCFQTPLDSELQSIADSINKMSPKLAMISPEYDVTGHLGISTINLGCDKCDKRVEHRAFHTWMITERSLDAGRLFLTLFKCHNCRSFSLVKYYEWDCDPDYVLSYQGKLHFYPKSFITEKLIGAIRLMAESLDVNKHKK